MDTGSPRFTITGGMREFDADDFDDLPEDDRLFQEAEDLMRQGRYQDAVARYEDLRQRSPGDPWAVLGHASALECAGKIPEAQRVIEEISTHNSHNRHVQRFCQLFYERREDMRRAQRHASVLQNSDAIFDDGPSDQLAELYFNQGRYLEANTELQRIMREEDIEDETSLASVLARVGACQRQNGELEDARSTLDRARELDPTNHWILSELAEAERGLDEYERARDHYESALELEPDDGWTRGRLANLEFDEGNLERAVLLYEQILEVEPNAVWALVELAQVLTESDPGRAAQLCQRALEQDPTYPWADAQLATLARLDDNLDKAYQHCQQALSHAPQNVWLLHELADICRAMGRDEEGLAHLRHAQGLAPFDATTYGFMADFLRGEGKYDEATAYLTKAVELDHDYTWAWRELCELHSIGGRHPQAEVALREVEDLEPDEAINDGLRAFLLRHRERREEALPYLERAVERQPDYFWAWRELIDYRLTTGDHEQAAADAQRALEALPNNVVLLLLQAEAQRRLGRRSEALTTVNRAIRIDSRIAQLWALRAELVLPDNRADAVQAASKACDFSDAPEFRVLLLQCLVAAGKYERAHAMLPALCGEGEEDAISSVPFELAAQFAEQDEDTDRAVELCERGLVAFPDATRLLVRRVRLGLDRSEDGVLERLRPVLRLGGPQPWHEIIPLFARGGDIGAVRRAAYMHIEQTRDDDESCARAWLVLAESVLMVGNRNEALQALATALTLDPELVPARLLASMLADQDGRHREALDHLLAVKTLLDAESDDDGEKPLEQAALLQQIASLSERRGELDEARRWWQELLETGGERPEVRLEYHCFQLRSGDHEAACAGLDRLIASEAPAERVFQRALYQRCLHDIQQQRSSQALERLREHEPALTTATALVAAQCALLEGDEMFCQRMIGRLEGDETVQREVVERLRVRLALSREDIERAITTARLLFGDDTSSESNAILLAETLVAAQRYEEALHALELPSLPAEAGLERLLWVACLRLERRGEANAFAWIGRHQDAADPDHGLVRLFNSAWPGAWGSELKIPAARLEDVLAMPSLIECARHIAKGLAAQGRERLVAALWLNLAQRFEGVQPVSSRLCHRRAAPWLRRCGEAAQARRCAWKGRAPLLWLRSWLP